jgi:hypothetical protein
MRPEDQHPLLATVALNGTDNRLSYASTATTSSNRRSRDIQTTQSTATADTDPGVHDSKASARTNIAYSYHKELDVDDSEYAATGIRNSSSHEPGYQIPRMPFDETRTSRLSAAAHLDYQDQHINSSKHKYMKLRVPKVNGHELDDGKPRIGDFGASQLESSSITPRPSLRHKTSSPSLRKPSRKNPNRDGDASLIGTV